VSELVSSVLVASPCCPVERSSVVVTAVASAGENSSSSSRSQLVEVSAKVGEELSAVVCEAKSSFPLLVTCPSIGSESSSEEAASAFP